MSRAPPSNCLFLPELPGDLTDPVLERHFCGFVGYTTSRTRHDRNGKLVGFVEFETVDSAVHCKERMQGQSPFQGINWHIHYSNSTSKGGGGVSKRPRDDTWRDPQPRSDAQRPSSYMDSRPGAPPMGPPPAPQYGGQPPMQHPPPPMSYQQPPPSYPVAPMDPGRLTHHPPPPNYLSHLPREASSCLYIEGLPSDATEREVSQIFRRFEGHGYQSIRMIPRESQKTPGKNLHLCFVEFDNAHQAMHAMNQLQGYRVDKNVEGSGIRISFSKQRSERRSSAAQSTGTPGTALRSPAARPSGSGATRYPQEEMQDFDGVSGHFEVAHSDYPPQEFERSPKGDRRRDGREHRDTYRDEYEDSERGEDDY